MAAAAEQPMRALAFSPDGIALASTGDDGKVHTWSAETGMPFEVFVKDAEGSSPAAAGATAPPQSETASRAEAGTGTMPPVLCFLDAHTVLAAKAGGAVAWDLNPVWTLERQIGTGDVDSPISDRVNAVRFSPDGRTLATGSGEPTRSGEVKLWNVADGTLTNDFKNVHSDAVLSLDFSPDGKYLASSSADRFVRVVELATGKVVKAFEGHTSYVLGVAWKRDSRTLASAGADNVIKVWDFTTGQRKRNIEGAGKEVTSVAFVGVTDQAVAASGDGQVRLLRENGEKVRSFEGATDFMNCAAATPDGKMIVAYDASADSLFCLQAGALPRALSVREFCDRRGEENAVSPFSKIQKSTRRIQLD
jgi:WD40 repeat protein